MLGLNSRRIKDRWECCYPPDKNTDAKFDAHLVTDGQRRQTLVARVVCWTTCCSITAFLVEIIAPLGQNRLVQTSTRGYFSFNESIGELYGFLSISRFSDWLYGGVKEVMLCRILFLLKYMHFVIALMFLVCWITRIEKLHFLGVDFKFNKFYYICYMDLRYFRFVLGSLQRENVFLNLVF